MNQSGNKVVLPWPPKELSPNHKVISKAGAMAKYRKQKEYKEACWILCKAAKLTKPHDDRIKVTVEFYQPDRHRRDQDNMVASIKYALDGVAAAIGVDDNVFDIDPKFPAELRGTIEVTIE
jgi:crossover junction endodeoxyribonuclease RusA